MRSHWQSATGFIGKRVIYLSARHEKTFVSLNYFKQLAKNLTGEVLENIFRMTLRKYAFVFLVGLSLPPQRTSPSSRAVQVLGQPWDTAGTPVKTGTLRMVRR
jgi:hypothetical protein